MTHGLEYPSLTVQWMPELVRQTDHAEHVMLAGTQAVEGEQNYVQQLVVNLPYQETEIDVRKYNDANNGGWLACD